ncbi:MAG: DEAD/DEAH box helicase [Vampirovibrionales bacterium]|nr:DEAD/DEAH box helicase [Vampirovibrionales bacterium]
MPDVLIAHEPVLNFAAVKAMAPAGAWRRGYNYFKEDRRIQKIGLSETGVEAKIKGNFKKAYTTTLKFNDPTCSEYPFEPDCSCPLNEPWCKHAVAVALTAAENNLWEAYWQLPIEDDMAADEALDDFEGRYQFWLDENRKPKFFAIRALDRRNGKAVYQSEQVLKKALSQPGGINEAQRREMSIFQALVKLDQLNSGGAQGWFVVPKSKLGELLPLLSQLEEVRDKDTGARLVFHSDPLKLQLSVNASMAGNVQVALHWLRERPRDVYPLEELTLYSRDLPWGRYKHHLFPLKNTLNQLPGHLTKATFSDIRDADGGKFMYEELPRLRKLVEVEGTEQLDKLRLEKRPPKKILSLELIDPASLRLRLSLSFSYDGVEVPFSKSAPETPYVMVVKKKEEQLYWVKRDLREEHAAYKKLMESRLEPLQGSYFQAEGDDAIDAANLAESKLFGKDWETKTVGPHSLEALKVSKHPLKIRAEIDFSKDSVDSFEAEIDCTIGKQRMDLDDVQNHLMQGKKYFYLSGAGFVEIPLADILQFGKTIQAFDAVTVGRDRYKIQTFKAGLIAELVDQGVKLKMTAKFQKFWDVIASTSDMEELDVPENVHAELRPYQKRGFNWLWFLYSYGLNGILADDMGLGKTLQALTVLQQAKNTHGQRPSLIVCPTSIVFNWQNEIARFTPDLKVINLTGSNRYGLYKKIAEADIVITSYALLRRDINALKNYPMRYVILDESQNIKNWQSQTALAAKSLQADHRLALSGTPIENRLSELWSVFDFLMPGFLYEPEVFRQKYTVPIEERGNRDAERRLKKQVFPFILRRMKQDVAKDLPPKIENVAYCELTDAQRQRYLDILEETRNEVFNAINKDGVQGSQRSIFTALTRLRQLCCDPRLLSDELSGGLKESGKFELMKDLLQEIVAENGRVLLFSQFVEMLKLIRAWLDKVGIKYEYLTGETKDREGAVNRFNSDASIPIFLISLKAGGTGLNLTGADYVMHYDPWWNPAAEDQATDRAHRIGQTKTVFVYRLIAKGTVEEKIMALKERKRDLVDSIIAADRSMGKFLTLEDLKEILSPGF